MTAQAVHPPELRHVTSNNDLLAPIPPHPSHSKEHNSRSRPAKLSTGLSATPPRLGTRTSSEIPSSPSSIHSSNSAIFERDIEPLPASLISTAESINGHVIHTPEGSPKLGSPSHHHHNLNPQVIENAVPAVLDSAIAALTEESNRPATDPAAMNIAIISPAPVSIHASGALTPTHIGSPTGLRAQTLSRGSKVRNPSGPSGPNSVVGGSRSPSPTRRSFSVNVPTGFGQTSPGSQSPRMAPERQNSIPHNSQLHPNTNTNAPLGSGTLGSSSPTQASSVNVSPQMSPLSNIMSLSTQDGMSSGIGLGADAHGHSPSQSQGGLSPLINQASKRLSFVSYSDILNSAPLSAIPFSSIVTSEEPPPHIPAVLGLTAENVPASGSSVVGSEGGEWLGGEWEREGFGRGLEARLEAVLNKEREVGAQAGLPSSPELMVDAPIAAPQ